MSTCYFSLCNAFQTQVQLFQPPAGPLLSRWELAADITQLLQQHMEETDWQVRAAVAVCAALVAIYM
jgi:hypothetical protein